MESSGRTSFCSTVISYGENYTEAQWGREVSVLECGLDNTYVYDNAGYFPEMHIISYNDVGLSSMYVMDCEYLAKIAKTLGHRRDAREILARGERLRKSIQSLWSEESGMFFCKDLETGELVRRMDPTNFLVYLGLRNYDCPEVRAELAEKSRKLLMKDWTKRGYIFENWNSVTGEGDDVTNSDRFYHWGALLGYISHPDVH